MAKVLLTAHCLDQLLEKNYSVITTVRNEEKAQKIRDAYKSLGDRLKVVIVPDLAKEDAFDDVVAQNPDIDSVLHTATDPIKELVDPAVKGTTGILRAVNRWAPNVRRVVITSSFASILDEAHLHDPDTTFTEASWNPDTIRDVGRSPATAYRVSKTLAERSAWDFVSASRGAPSGAEGGSGPASFDLVTICPPLVLGPVVDHLVSLESVNTSNERVVDLLRGRWRHSIPSQGPVSLWVDVRDVARAHVRALEIPEAGGKRLFTTARYFSNSEIAAIVRNGFPEYADKVPGPEVQGGERPEPHNTFAFDVSFTDRLLGIRWIDLETSVKDLVKTFKAHGL
ncbi:Nucleoside-diphosphate-sugar epimerase [Geosmithia morbida]|uniref:Nucleoside-diphosphate-sugar epimerase n=1 Tax=Geosmithia morbida TaxID=1094350 RepID=A0A9P4YVM8_9HYPO|nr:Nucleoside-diphosphate-sugar epimerase [Geosmithia morbida]KAF4123675.1 Nucleoside-diphosphate-sugar epimerase [Geosmithia morbida]